MLLIVDSNEVAYRSFFAGGRLSYQDVPTGVIYKFLKKIEEIGTKIRKPATLVFCWDHDFSKRKEMYPEYKSNRNKDSIEGIKDLFQQMEFLQDEFVEIGFYSYQFYGLEADDIIASICIDNPREEKIIVSQDSDMYQVLDKKTSMLRKTDKETVDLYTLKAFKKEYGVTPEDWILVKAIAGCAVDNIKGVSGIGEKRAIQFINDVTDKWDREIIRNWKTVERNVKLVFLPMEPITKVKKIKPRKWDYDRFHEMLLKKGIRNIDQKLWRKVYGFNS